jgi:hypothetical protein
MTMNEHGLSRPTLILGLLLTTASLAACDVGYKEIGGDTETGDGDGDPGDGDGDPGDGDGEPGDGDGDPGNCPPPPGHFGEVAFDYQLTIFEYPDYPLPLDQSCTIASITPGEQASIELDCPFSDVRLDLNLLPGIGLFGKPGDPVHLWLWHVPEPETPVLLRMDFPEYNGTLVLLDTDDIAPMSDSFHFPAPWSLAAVDSCGPVEQLCDVTQPEQLEIKVLGEPLAAWAGDYARADLSEAYGELWVDRAEQIVEIKPACEPSLDFYRSYRLLIHTSTPLPVEGEVCDPGESNPCSTGLHCCYPCGIEGCDFVCTPEDPNTLECPPPPP